MIGATSECTAYGTVVVCDSCAREYRVLSFTGLKSELCDELRIHGWKLKDGQFCPACVAKMRERRNKRQFFEGTTRFSVLVDGKEQVRYNTRVRCYQCNILRKFTSGGDGPEDVRKAIEAGGWRIHNGFAFCPNCYRVYFGEGSA